MSGDSFINQVFYPSISFPAFQISRHLYMWKLLPATVQLNADCQSRFFNTQHWTYLYFFKKGFKIRAFPLDEGGNILADERLYLPFWIAIENNCLYKRKHLYESTWLKLPSIFNIWGLSYDLLWWLWTVTASISHKFCFFILVDGPDCKY